jgi:hypothetical protein
LRGNELLVIDAGNQFPSRAIAPYATFPSWWRRFAFQLLSPRALVTYLYLCTLFDPNSIAYPLKAQIMEDMGLKNRASLNEALEELETLGFMVSAERQLQRQVRETRTVFQRTSPEFTLLKLLQIGKIDGDLFPISAEEARANAASSDRVVATGLRNLLGDAAYDRYIDGFAEEQRRETLVGILTEQLERRRRAAAQRRAQPTMP